MAIDLTKSNNFDLVVIDSAAALCPDEEDQKDMADHSMALRARLLSKFCRKVTGPAADSGTTIFIINQRLGRFETQLSPIPLACACVCLCARLFV